jgi:hypothetical protein
MPCGCGKGYQWTNTGGMFTRLRYDALEMNLLTKFRDLMTPAQVLPHAALKDLVFGQQHLLTQGFFEKHYGQAHTIGLEDFPHYRFLTDHLGKPASPSLYSDYLQSSWSYLKGKEKNTSEERNKKIAEFVELYRNIERRKHLGAKAITRPLTICKRPDGRYVIVHGNHRASVALKLGLDVQAKEIPLPAQLKKVATIPDEFYGSKRLNRPYQSIFYEGKELVEGRRRDINERLQKIDVADLRGKTVLDLGCNLGMSSYLAAERGAKRVVGVEYSPQIASAAIRLNAYFCRPVHFIQHDLSTDLELNEQFDTVFCLSLIKHLKSPEAITALIKRATKKILYFESHAHTSAEDYPYLLNKQNFSKIELVDHMSDGVHSKKRTRALYRCEV